MTDTHFCLDDSPQFQMIELDEVTSTNDFLRDYRPVQERRITLVTAEFQTAGRGSGTNRWVSERGKNLVFSLLTHPRHIEANRMFVLSEALALAIRDALEREELRIKNEECLSSRARAVANFSPFTLRPSPFFDERSGRADYTLRPSPFTIKWPNDIYCGDKKICGMLIENDLQGGRIERSIMGVGVNVNQTDFGISSPADGKPTYRVPPTSLALIVGHEVERRFVLESVMENFSRYYAWTEQGRGAELHEMYLQHLYRKDEMHRFIDGEGEFRGTITDVEPTGHLIIIDEMGRKRRYAFKEVEYSE